MEEENLTALEEEIRSQFEQVKKCEPGSDEQKQLVENIEKLYKLRQSESSNCFDQEEREERLKLEKEKTEAELELRKKQDKITMIIGCVKLAIELLGIGLPAALYLFGLIKGFKFETEGTYTSGTFRNFVLNRMNPRKWFN